MRKKRIKYKCRCTWCLSNKQHKNRKRMSDMKVEWEEEYSKTAEDHEGKG